MNPTLLKCLYVILTQAAFLTAKTVGQILDADGDPLEPGVGYYVLPVDPAGRRSGSGSGLTLASRGSSLCPVDIVRGNNVSPGAINGLPVKFSVWMSSEGSVTESDFVTIETDVGATTIRLGPMFWLVDGIDGERNQKFVTTGPKADEFGPESLNSLFKIENVDVLGRVYKFVSCLKHCETCSLSCGDIGMFVDEVGVQRLALGNETYLVRFKRAG